MATWKSRLYQLGDEKLISTLYESVFNLQMPLELWRWRYLDNQVDNVAILLAFSDDDQELAGQYSLCSLPMKLNNQEIVGSFSLDTMVHPAFRGQGMFTELAIDLYNRIAEDGIPLVYGFPNVQSHHGFSKYLGWKDLVKSIPIFVRPLNFSKILELVLHLDFIMGLLSPLAQFGYDVLRRPKGNHYKHYSVIPLSKFDERFDILWQEACDIAPILVRRDRNYLKWRYASHPIHEYSILAIEDGDMLIGYSILRIKELAGLQAGYIVDLLVHPDAKYAQDALLEATVRLAQAERCDLISCLMLEHIPYVDALKRRGFTRVPDRIMPQKMYLGARNNGSGFPDEFIHNSKNWYITWGDHDRI